MKPMELSEIRKTRKRLGMSQSELARKTGVSQSLIARIESGKIDPGYSKVAAIFAALSEAHEHDVPVSELMSHKVYGVKASETIEKAASKMEKYGVSQMPVFEKEKLVGSLSESTILNQIAAGVDMKDLSKRKVYSYMEDPLPTVNPNTPIATVSLLLETNPAVIVIEKGKIKGIATKADLLKMMHQ